MDGGQVPWRRRLEALLGVPATDGNRVAVLRNGDEIFPAMLEAIEGAERSVDLLTFIYWEGPIAERFAGALADRARAGVRVRLLLDAFGARKLPDDLAEAMVEAGVDLRWFRPPGSEDVTDIQHRTHRKVLVCDERIGFTGGVGIAEEWTGDARGPDEWRDTHLRIEGPAVDGLRGAFVDDWFDTTHDLADEAFDTVAEVDATGPHAVQIVTGTAGPGHSDIGTLHAALLEGATRHVRMAAAYFTPNERIVSAMHHALERGVEIDVCIPGPHADKGFMRVASQACFEELLDAGARIWTFQPSMLHCKVWVVDDEVATCGSANVDDRAVRHDDEVNAVLFDADVVEVLARHFDEDLERSEAIDLDDWVERGLFRRAAERAVDAVSGLL